MAEWVFPAYGLHHSNSASVPATIDSGHAVVDF
jgi:hypothetical protein